MSQWTIIQVQAAQTHIVEDLLASGRAARSDDADGGRMTRIRSRSRDEMPQPAGFTLIELLIVIGILLVLAAMLMPLLGMADRMARTTGTRAIMAKVDSALRRYRNDIGSYPWQASYADLAAGATPDNRLAYHLGRDIAAADLAKVRADAAAAAALYAYVKSAPPASAFAFLITDTHQPNHGGPVAMVNRMAAERARLAMFAGNIALSSPRLPPVLWTTPAFAPRRVLPTTPLLAAPASKDAPGFAADYLHGEIEPRRISGESILDAWGRPIIYVGQVVEGTVAALATTFMGMWCSQLRAAEYGLQPVGRTSLAEQDAWTGAKLVADAAGLPDLANLRHSDRRRYAAPGLEATIELWSAGHDGRAAWMRDDPANRDNVALQPYDARLP